MVATLPPKKFSDAANCSRNTLSASALTTPRNRLQLLTTRNHSVGTPLTTFVVNVCRRLRQQSFETRGASHRVGIVRTSNDIFGDTE